VVGALGLGALFYGSGIGTETSKKLSLSATESQGQKPVRAMNLALGPMVFVARELDFTVKNAIGEKLEDSRIGARVETQLQGLRDLYRREIAKNPKLMGSMILQLNINPAGQVSQVKEITARLNDPEFRQTVAAETGKWAFAELVAEPVTVQIPLLFVEEGMDITTLVRWEGVLAGAPVKVVAAAKPETAQPAKAASPAPPPAAGVKPAASPEKAPPATVKTEGEEMQIKYATLLRKEPNFSAPVLTTFTIGTKVTVINRSSDWLEVRSHHNGPSGYIRKEFVVPVDVVVNR
jgi:hypothetical protein